MNRNRILALALALPVAGGCGFAGQVVTLNTGFQLRAKSIEYTELTAKIVTETGTMEFQRSKIASVEHVEDPKPAPPPVALPSAPMPASEPPASVPPAPKPLRSAEEVIQDAAARYGLPPALVRSVARTESGLRQDAISPKGAIGVMQLMPATAARLEADPHDLEQNVDAGARYLRDLLLRYDGSAYKALAAYNAGEQAVDRYNGIPPYEETQTYVRRVLWRYTQSESR